MHDFINSSLYNYTILHKFYKAILILYPENLKKIKKHKCIIWEKEKIVFEFLLQMSNSLILVI